MRILRLLIIFIFPLLFPLLSLAELRGPDFHFVHINTEDGLPSDRVRDIVQDEDGFMWFATDGGLVRYDGLTAKVFIPTNPKKSEDIYVLRLARYHDGILVGTDRGLYIYDPEKEKLSIMPLSYDKEVKERIEGSINSIATDEHDNIWVSVDRSGIFKISPEGIVSYQYKFPETGNYITKIYVDDRGTIWAVSNNESNHIYKFDPRESEFKTLPIKIKGNPFRFGASAITQDSKGDYWLGTWTDGLIRFNPHTGEGQQFAGGNSHPTWHIHSITEYEPGLLFVGSDNGLLLLDTISGEYYVYSPNELNDASMTGRFVYPITKDSEGGFWIGTFYRGVNYLGKKSSRFNNWHHSAFQNSVGGNIVSRIVEDSQGNIWIGSADGGLSKFDPKRRSFKHYPLSGDLEIDNINALCADGDRIWVGTYGNGIGYLDINTGRWYPIEVKGEPNTSSYAVFRDSSGNIWAGATGLLTLYNPKENKFEKVSDLKSWINDIDEGENGELWISTQGAGLFRYDPYTKRWKNYRSSSSAGSIPHNHINSLKYISPKEVYVSTAKGICKYDMATDKFETLPGFPENLVAYALEKSQEELWISSNRGVVRLNKNGEGKTYTVADGLGDNQFLPGSSLIASDGTIYFGSVYGFSSVNPTATRMEATAPILKFTGLDIVNKPIEVGDAHLNSSLNHIDKLELDNTDHTFTIYFSALSYDKPDRNMFLYRLEGFDKTWHNLSDDNKVTYSNLPPGTYTFRLKGANSDGVWNDEGISMNIVVKPVWYQSTFMKLLYLVLVLALVMLGLRYVLWRMERHHVKELERISDNKEKEMFRSKLNFFTVIAHEIRTPVSLIIAPLEQVLSSKEKFADSTKEELKVVDRNARRLLALVNQLLDFKKAENNDLSYGFRHVKIVLLLQNIIERFLPSLQQKNISVNTDFPDPDMEVDVDPESITKLTSNLINNAKKFTNSNIFVGCRILKDSDKFEIEVKDNGIGISRENQDKIFQPFFQVLDNINEAKGGTGLGLSIVKNVVDAHGGEIKLDSVPGKGSSFTVILPIHQKEVVPDLSPDEINFDSTSKDISPSEDDSALPEDPVLLVVDDNLEMLKFISSHFDKNYEVITATNGEEALQKMKEKPVSLIICDWMMPVMDGEEFLNKIRQDEHYSHIPFVMLTAKTDNDSKITSMKSGADAYVEKPFSLGYLDARIENLLEMRSLLRKKYSQTPLEPLTSIAQTDVDNEFLTRLQKIIEENFSNPELNVDYIAERLCISRSGLYAKIKSLADVTPNELIQITRLKKAAELLAENKYRINEICYMVGFNSSSYFSRCFQKQFGMKPGEFISKS